MYLDNNFTTKSLEMWMCVVSQYFPFRRENTLRECLSLNHWKSSNSSTFFRQFLYVHEKKGKRGFSVILFTFFHSSGRGGEDASTRGEKEVREAGKLGSKWQGKEKVIH